jgi:hypothetical protein
MKNNQILHTKISHQFIVTTKLLIGPISSICAKINIFTITLWGATKGAPLLALQSNIRLGQMWQTP